MQRVYVALALFAILGFSSFMFNSDTPTGFAIKSYVYDTNEFVPRTYDDEITIGVMTPLTGPYSFIGEETKKAVKLFQKQNRDTEISIIYHDTKCNSKKALQGTRKLIHQDQVDYILGADCYGYSEYYLFGTEQDNVPTLLLAPPQETIHDDHMYSFNSPIEDEISKLKSLTIPPTSAIIVQVDTYFGDVYTEELKNIYERTNFIDVKKYRLHQNDFRLIIKEIKEKNPRAIFFVAENDEIVSFMNQLYSAEYYNQVFTNFEVNEEMIKNMGEASEGLIYISEFDSQNPNMKTKLFVKQFEAEHQTTPNLYSAQVYDSLEVLKLLTDKFGNNPPVVREGFKAVQNYNGVMGVLSFTPTQTVKSYYVKEVKQQKSVLI